MWSGKPLLALSWQALAFCFAMIAWLDFLALLCSRKSSQGTTMTNTERRTTSFWFKMRFHHWCCETSAPLGAGWCFAVWKRHWVLRNLGARHGDEGNEERDEDHGDEGDEGHPGEDSDEDSDEE